MLRQFAYARASKKLCLIADRSVPIRRAAAAILNDLRFHVTEAETEQEAISIYQQHRPEAVLLDRAMAEADEFAFLRSLTDKAPASSSKIILCTADRNAQQIARALGAGADEYLVKPFDRTILTAKFEQLGLTA